MLGRLSWDALPFYSAIALGGALVVVGAAIGTFVLITVKGWWGPLWRNWLTTLDHKRLGIMYVVLALVMLLRGFVDAIMMRAQQAMAMGSDGYLPPEHYNQIFSSHGSIMVFFMLMPFLTGFINYVVPLQIGARDIAFPFLNAASLWLTVAGAGLMMTSLVLGRFSTGGWTGYPPFTELGFSPGVGVDYWIWALTLSGVGTTLTGINVIVTIWKLRAPGMKMMDLPLFCWTSLCASLLMVFAFPALTVATMLLAADRTLGMHFFTNGQGGNMMMYANLFWLWGHPEVYILILPAFGVFSEVISTFSSKRLFGYTSLVYATMAISVLSFCVWIHHFFTMGQGANVNAAFGIATMVIAVPTGVKVYDWLFTMYRGRLRITSAMLWAIGFIVTFVIGGVTGVLLAIPPVDYVVHNSVFLVAHFHNMLIPGALFGMFAAYTFWFPKAMGFHLDEAWGKRAFWFWIVGFYLAFMPLYALGLMGMSRRMQQYDRPEWQPWLAVAALGALSILAGIVCQIVQLRVSVRDRVALSDESGDPWEGRTLEWQTASPPPPWNFAVQKGIEGRDAFWQLKLKGDAYPGHEDDDYEDIELPRNSFTGFGVGIAGFFFGFAMVWHIWWLAGLAIVVICALVIGHFSRSDNERTVEAEELRAYDRARLEHLRGLSSDLSHGVHDMPPTGVAAELREQSA